MLQLIRMGKRDAQRNNSAMNKGKNKAKVRYEFRPKEKEVIKEGTRKTQIQPNKNIEKSRNENVNNSHVDTNCHNPKPTWKLNKEKMKNWRSANKFSVLEDIEDAEVFYGTKKSEHEIVDKFVDYQRKKKAFRIPNYIADKHKFKEIMEKEWNIDTNGCKMYRLKDDALILKEYNIAKQNEEKLLYHQAKIEWWSDGNRNAKFFHVVVKGRAHRNKIKFLGKEVPVIEMKPNTIHITNKFSMEDATMMTRLVNDEEVKKALFDISDNKALGPDGFTSNFYKKAWNIMGKDVCEAVKDFFSTGKLIGGSKCHLDYTCS
ncbi:hypothetical protein Tco_0467911 [Tanacetum coccineum]